MMHQLSSSNCTGIFTNSKGVIMPRVWYNRPFSFDNIGESLLTVLETVALKGWHEKLYASTDNTGVDLEAQRFTFCSSSLDSFL